MAQREKQREKTHKEKLHKETAPEDYRLHRPDRRETLMFIAFYSALDGAVAWLFYHNIIAFIVLLPGAVPFWHSFKKALAQRRRDQLRVQFLVGMQMVCTALRAGYAIENTFREALKELRGMYGEEAPIVQEFTLIVTQIGLNTQVESLLLDLGDRSGVEDIRSFAEVFSTARRTGGDLLQIITNTVSAIERKEETMSEIRTLLAGKEMELYIMSLSPLGIMAYITLTSPSFLASLYGNETGVILMSVCLGVYAGAFLWGRYILDIEV